MIVGSPPGAVIVLMSHPCYVYDSYHSRSKAPEKRAERLFLGALVAPDDSPPRARGKPLYEPDP